MSFLTDPLGSIVGGALGINIPDPLGDMLGGGKAGGGAGGAGGLLGGILGGGGEGGGLGGIVGGLLGGGGGGGAGGLLGGILGGGDPLGGLIGAAGDALGLPKELTGALKVGAGIFTGDVMCAVSGGAEFLSSAAQDMSAQARSSFDRPCSCVQGYAPPRQGGMWDQAAQAVRDMTSHHGPMIHHGVPVNGYPHHISAHHHHHHVPPHHQHHDPPPAHHAPPPGHHGGPVPTHCPEGPTSTTPSGGLQEQYAELKTLEENFDQIDMRYMGPLFGHDGHIDMDDLQHLSASANCPPDVKRAVRYVMENPALYAKLAQSGGAITRADLEIAMDDTQKAMGGVSGAGGGSGQNVPGPTDMDGGGQGVDRTGDSGGTSGSSSSSGANASGSDTASQITDILNDPSMGIEEKIEQVLTLIEQQLDDQMGDVMQQMADNQSKAAGADSKDKKGAESAQNNQEQLQFKLQQLVEKRKAMFDLLSNVESKFSEMANLAIQNLGRA